MIEHNPHLVGYRCYSIDTDTELQIVLFFYGEDGKPAPEIFSPIIIWKSEIASDNYTKRARIKIIADAMCRYLNAGGESSEVSHVINELLHAVGSQLMLTPDHRLIAVQEDVTYGMVFQCTTGEFIHIVPDEFSSELTSVELLGIAIEDGLEEQAIKLS